MMSIKELYNIYKQYPNICTDSRNIKTNSIFFSLKGENFNGNKFAHQAIKNGCKFAIVDEKKYQNNKCLLVKDTLKSLQKLASYHRKKLNLPVIGITGTNGKTTTKELLNAVLSTTYNTYYTKGNFNNQIGVPISILEINNSHEIAVIEMGANQIGEISNLCEISQPTQAIITNIGIAHMEGFKNIAGVTKAKTELYSFIKEKKGRVFVNANDKILILKSQDIKRTTYGNTKNVDYKIEVINRFPFLSIKLDNVLIHSNLIGNFQYDNISAASCVGDYFNVSADKIKEGIESYIPKNNRTEIVETKNNYIILDAYNANPSSMYNMIDSFNDLNKENKLCILGDMLELGSHSKKEHDSIVKEMRNLQIPVIYIGKEFCKSVSIDSFKNISDFIKKIKLFNLKNKTILIKGSRGIELEKIVPYL